MPFGARHFFSFWTCAPGWLLYYSGVMSNNNITATAETKMEALETCAAKVQAAGRTLSPNWDELHWEWNYDCTLCTATYWA